jgi:hypothetical protein
MRMSYETLQLPLTQAVKTSTLYNSPRQATKAAARGVDQYVVGGDRLAALVDRVAPYTGPETLLELVALLEAAGITDAVAQEYGAADVFELARRLLRERRPSHAAARRLDRLPELPKPRLLPPLLRGPVTLAVMAVLLAGLRYYELVLRQFGAPTWTTLLGLMSGMVIAAATMQALGWRVSLALSQGIPQAVRPTLLLGLGFGFAVALLAALVLVAIGHQLHVPIGGLVGLGESCAGLAMLLILSGCLALLDRGWLAVPALLLSFGTAGLVRLRWPGADPLLTQIVPGLAAALLLLAGLLAYTVQQQMRGGGNSDDFHLPSKGQLLYRATPYMAYGALAVIYLLVEQINGWLARLPADWPRSQAVAAVDMAHLISLAALVLSQGSIEYALRTFWPLMYSTQVQTVFNDQQAATRAMWCFLGRAERRLLVAHCVIAIALAALALWLWQALALTALLGPLLPKVLLMSLLGYSALAWGLFGCSFLVTLSQPWCTVRALLIATIVQIASSLVLGQIGTFETAMMSTVIGGAVLVILTQLSIARLHRQASYALYQAF